jgi:lysyl-tRNA synthetase class 2
MNRSNKPNWLKLKDREIDWSVFKLRSKILQCIRSYFQTNDFLEVEVPILTSYPTLDPNISSVETAIHNQKGKPISLFLHTSPEHAIKKLLATGATKLFYLGKVFRDAEFTRLHNPEFTMLEWYRTYASYHDIQNDVQELICYLAKEIFSFDHLIYQGDKIQLTSPWARITLRELFLNQTGIDLKQSLSLPDLIKSASAIGILPAQDDDWEDIFFRIFIEKIEPGLGSNKPIFVLDYPIQMGLMAKRKECSQEWVERVELYIAGLELANGYSELLDPVEQKYRFIEEQKRKENIINKKYPIDYELLTALGSDIPPSAGIALGLDRLVMLFADKLHIQDVILFPML